MWRCCRQDKGRKVEEGTHDELMRIQVLKDEDETVYQGYYHNQWDTQMGEESFGDNASFSALCFC